MTDFSLSGLRQAETCSTSTMHPVTVQISLDLISIDEALIHARKAVRAGVDWLEAGTPLLLATGLRGVEALRAEFPKHPIVADLKTMDGGYLEAEIMARAGATHVVVMARAHEATIKMVVKAARDYGIKVMGDDLACENKPAACHRMQDLGVDYIVHHVGYDERRDREVVFKLGRTPSPLDELDAVVRAVDIPVQAVGGLTLEQAITLPQRGAPLIVLGAPLVVDADSFSAPKHDWEAVLTEIVRRVKSQP
jgi:3-hexulose-6-phosphate synthase/6-phospho-3-hexuloisomerase